MSLTEQEKQTVLALTNLPYVHNAQVRISGNTSNRGWTADSGKTTTDIAHELCEAIMAIDEQSQMTSSNLLLSLPLAQYKFFSYFLCQGDLLINTIQKTAIKRVECIPELRQRGPGESCSAVLMPVHFLKLQHAKIVDSALSENRKIALSERVFMLWGI